MREFNDWINFHDIVDLPLRCAKFTWSNLQETPEMSRLDHFFSFESFD